MSFERVGTETVWEGKVASVHLDRVRHDDGEEVTRERVAHPGAVAIVAHDDLHVWMVRQPREAVGDPGLLELPAGKLDVEGEPPLETARRELAEEIGKSAREWEELAAYWSSPGFTDERVIVYLATGLEDARHDSDPEERIEVVPWPLLDLEGLIEACEDAKSLVGLLWLSRLRSR